MAYAEQIKQMVRLLSFEKMNFPYPVTNLSLVECPYPADLVYGSFIAHILVAGAPFKLTFRVHFKCSEVRGLIANFRETPIDRITDAYVIDLMKEFCNLVAGGIKKIFIDQKIACGIALPCLNKGVDEILYKSKKSLTSENDIWCLKWDLGAVTCVSSLEVFDLPKIEVLTFDPAAAFSAVDEDPFL
ncbi:MAG: hypothetical protein EOP10_10625 [Proteobacteria bacterium]|nr:MAG: hypothetical protein EOP10_10625 [Pseudomonadota bacterium]